MITTEELVSFINHPQFKADLANECISIYISNNKHLSIDELGNVIEKNNNSSSEYEIVNPSAVIEFYKESIIEKINDYVDYGETYSLNELKNKVNLLEDIQDYCFSREESEVKFERAITNFNSNFLQFDLDQGFWTSSDSFKTKVHISTNYLSDEYVRLITSYENRDDEEKNYIDNLIATNPNESYITISINPTTEEIEFTLNGIYHANLINNLKYDYKFQLIKDLSKLLYNVDTIDNSTTNEYKQQIGSNFEKYKEIVDSVVVDALVNSICDIYSGGDIYSGDEEPDCRYYCEFDESILGLSQEFDEYYRIGLVFNKERECVDYFIDRVTVDFVDSDVQKELSPYNKEIFKIAENKIKNYVEKKWDLLKEKSLQHEKEVDVLWNKGILLFKDTKYWEDILTETPAENSKENESFILSKLHSKFRQEIVDKFNPNENINWETESWNYVCETMQRKSLDYDYSVNYVNGLTSKDLQDFIANDFITIKMNLQDKEMESLWEELEDIPFIEDEDGRLILDSDESWHNFEPGTTKEEIWHYFDINHSKGINYLVNEYGTKTKELQEQSKKDGYEAGYLFDSDESIISWKELKKIDSTFSNADFIEIIREIKESNENLSEKELKEELVFRIIEDEVDWHGFEHSLIDNEQIDSGKLLDTRCYILEQVSEAVVNKQINSFEKIQNKVDELLFNDSRTKDFFIMDCVKSEIDKDFDFWQEIDCNPRGSVNDTIGSYQFLAGISNEVAKKLGLSLRNEDENLNYQYEILGTYEMIPEKFTESGQSFIRFDNREIDFCCNISSDDETFMKQEIFSFDFHDSNYSYDILYKYFDKCVAKSMEQTQEYELFLNNPQEYVEKCVLSIVAPTVPSIEPMQIVEEVSKEELNIEKDFKNLLLENLKTSKNPFEATYKIFEDLKEKNDTEKIKKFNQYLKDNDCNTKKDFEKFFTEIIGLTKKDPKRSIRKLKIERELER